MGDETLDRERRELVQWFIQNISVKDAMDLLGGYVYFDREDLPNEIMESYKEQRTRFQSNH